jgi:hypothetical protein
MGGGPAHREGGTRCDDETTIDPGALRIRGQPRAPLRRDGNGGAQGPDVDLRDKTPAQLFGRAVYFLRRGRGVRQVDLAARASVSLGRLSGIERGEYAAWRRAADRLAVALDFPDARELLRRFYGNDLPTGDPADLLIGGPESPDGDGQ